LTKGLQCRLGDDGVTDDAVERRAVAPCTSDPGRGPRRRRWRSFPPLKCSLGSVRVCGVGCAAARTANRGPHPLFIALCDGGPPTMDWLGTPDQGARMSPLWPFGRNGREIELTSSFNRVTFTKSAKITSLCKTVWHNPAGIRRESAQAALPNIS
jgi:hypothetical protein